MHPRRTQGPVRHGGLPLGLPGRSVAHTAWVLAAAGDQPYATAGRRVRSAADSGELAGLMRVLDGRAPDPVSVAVRQPTLDDVFLSLTRGAKDEHDQSRGARRVQRAANRSPHVAWRNLLTQLRTPQALVFATIQPVIFVLLFRYAFGGAIRVPGTNYVDFLMPGIFAQTVAFGAVGTAVGLSGDLRTGILVVSAPCRWPGSPCSAAEPSPTCPQPACHRGHDRRRLRRRIPQPARRGRPAGRARPCGRVRVRDLLGLRLPRPAGQRP